MQTISLEQGLNLLDGVPYDIDFAQFNNCVIADISADEIIAAVLEPPAPAPPPTSYPSCEELENSRKLFEACDKNLKEEKKWWWIMQCWEKESEDSRSAKQAYKNLKHLCKKMGV